MPTPDRVMDDFSHGIVNAEPSWQEISGLAMTLRVISAPFPAVTVRRVKARSRAASGADEFYRNSPPKRPVKSQKLS